MKLTEHTKNNFIFTCDDALTPEFCKELIDLFEKDKRKYPGIMGDGKVHLEVKRSTDFQIRPAYPEWKPYDDFICKKMVEVIHALGEHLVAMRECVVKDTGYNIQRTEVGQEFKWHSDVGNKGNCDRMFAVIFYLNEVEEGGTTDFHYQGVSIAPKTGRVLVFPASFTHVHRGDVVKKGTKYIITTFINYAV